MTHQALHVVHVEVCATVVKICSLTFACQKWLHFLKGAPLSLFVKYSATRERKALLVAIHSAVQLLPYALGAKGDNELVPYQQRMCVATTESSVVSTRQLRVQCKGDTRKNLWQLSFAPNKNKLYRRSSKNVGSNCFRALYAANIASKHQLTVVDDMRIRASAWSVKNEQAASNDEQRRACARIM